MKREDLRAIDGLTEAQVYAVMALAGRDRAAASAREETLQQQLTIAQQGLAAFGTQKPADLNDALQQVQTLQQQLNEQAAAYRFREFARSAAQDAGAIDAEDVVSALAQNTALLQSSNQDTDIRTAVEELKTKKPHWFRQEPTETPNDGQAPSRKVVVPPPNNPKAAPGSDPTAAEFAMMDYMARMELKAKNPTLFAELRKALQAANRNY